MSTPKVYMLIAGLAVLLISLAWYGHTQRQYGKRDLLLSEARASEKLAVTVSLFYERRSDSLVKVVKATEQKYSASRESFTRSTVVYRNRVDSIQITDTTAVRNALESSDAVIASANVALDAADSLISKQRALIASQRSELTARDSVEGALRRQNKMLEQEAHGSRIGNMARAVRWMGTGALVLVAVQHR